MTIDEKFRVTFEITNRIQLNLALRNRTHVENIDLFLILDKKQLKISTQVIKT